MHTSRRERIAVGAEREYLDVQRVRLMQAHVGETFEGVIAGVAAFGFFVQLKDFFVEGLVHVTNLSDYFVFDEARMTLRGKRSGQVFELGKPVTVLLAAANPIKRQLDFELVQKPAPAGARPHAASSAKTGTRPSPKGPRTPQRSGRNRRRGRRSR